MRYFTLLILSALPLLGQTSGNVTMVLYPGAPTGSCNTRQIALNQSNGHLYTCFLGVWQIVSGGVVGGLGGSGTLNAIPKFTASTTLGDSLVTDTGITLNYAGTGGITANQFHSTGTGPVLFTSPVGAVPATPGAGHNGLVSGPDGWYVSNNNAAWVGPIGVGGPGGSVPPGTVTSVFGRSGPTITAHAGDYGYAEVTGAAPTNSPVFTGTPTAPNPANGDDSQRVATTAWVKANTAAPPPSLPGGPPVWEQTVCGKNSGNTATVAVSGLGIVPGDTVLVTPFVRFNGGTVDVDDNGSPSSNSYTEVRTYIGNVTARFYIFSAKATVQATTVTAHFDANRVAGACVSRYRNVQSLGANNSLSQLTPNTATPSISLNVAANSLMFAALSQPNGPYSSTQLTGELRGATAASGVNLSIAHCENSGVGSVSCSITASSSGGSWLHQAVELIGSESVPSGFAPIHSPAFSGIPEAPTPAAGNNSTQIATTAFVAHAIANLPGGGGGGGGATMAAAYQTYIQKYASFTKYYISSTGSGTTCTQSAPCALSAANIDAHGGPGVAFMFADGTYTRTTNLQTNVTGSSTQHLAFVSENYGGAKIVHNGAGANGDPIWRTANGNYLDFVGLDWSGPNKCWTTYAYPDSGGGYSKPTGGYTFAYNRIHDIATTAGAFCGSGLGGGGVGGSNVVVATAGAFTVTNNVIWNLGDATNGHFVHGVYMGIPGSVMTNNIIYNVKGAGITTFNSTAGGSQNITIANNTIYNTDQDAQNAGIQMAGGTCVAGGVGSGIIVVNNIVANGQRPLQTWCTSGNISTATVANNLLFGNAQSNTWNASNPNPTNTITQDPLFVNAAAANFHIASGSPAAGQGTSTNAPATDILGVTRASPPSIGAYEGTGGGSDGGGGGGLGDPPVKVAGGTFTLAATAVTHDNCVLILNMTNTTNPGIGVNNVQQTDVVTFTPQAVTTSGWGNGRIVIRAEPSAGAIAWRECNSAVSATHDWGGHAIPVNWMVLR